MIKTALIFSMIVLSSGCVTLKFGGTESKRANGVEIREPSAPFRRENIADVDAAFKNTKNGNLISYLSDCNDPTDPSLEAVVTGILSGISDLSIQKQQVTSFRGREAREVSVKGKVDGVASAIDLFVFKRNQCMYIVTYVGVENAFQENREDFRRFLEDFKVP